MISTHRHIFGKTTRRVFRKANGVIGCRVLRVTTTYSRGLFARLEQAHNVLMRRIS